MEVVEGAESITFFKVEGSGLDVCVDVQVDSKGNPSFLTDSGGHLLS